MKLNQKLISGFLVIALLMGLMGYISVDISQQTLEKSIEESSIVLVKETMDKIDRNIQNRFEAWHSYAYASRELHNFIIESNQEFDNFEDIESYINEKNEDWISTSKEEITPFMQNLINNKISQQLRKKSDFHEKEEGYKVYGEVFVTNKYGANIAQTGKTTDYKQDDEVWWQKASEEELYIENIEYDESTSIYSISAGIKISDESGNFLGVMKVVLNIEELISMLKEIELTEKHETMHLKLLTSDGKIIYASEEYYDYGILDRVSEKLLSRLEKEENNSFISDELEPEEGKILFAHTHSHGHKNYKGLDWILMIEHETEEILKPVEELRNSIFLILFIFLAISVLISIFIAHNISKPIIKLKNTAIQIGKGNLRPRVKIKSKDEIGELGDSINKMAFELRKKRKELETHNKQLQSEIKIRKKAEMGIKKKSLDLERFTKVAIKREEKMIELKKKLTKNKK